MENEEDNKYRFEFEFGNTSFIVIVILSSLGFWKVVELVSKLIG